MMLKKVLWFDDDPAIVSEFLKEKPEHLEVEVVRNLTDAEEKISHNKYDLLILDIMIPTKTSQEEEKYPPSATNVGTKTGLIFYKYWKRTFKKEGTQVLVYTILRLAEIRKAFENAGLPGGHFITKASLREPSAFWDKICHMLEVKE